MPLDESLELIKEVLNNRIEKRLYDYYLNTLIFSLFSKDKPQSYSKFKEKIFNPKKTKVSKMTKEEKKALSDRNNKILKSMKAGD